MKQTPEIFCFQESSIICDSISSLIIDHFNIPSVEFLHTVLDSDLFIRGSDQASAVHELIYSHFDTSPTSDLLNQYRSLCRRWVHLLRERHGITDWAVQAFPSLRVQFPGNLSVFEFHRDSDYNHPLGEINHFVGITKCTSTAALWYERHLGWDDYVPLELSSHQSAMINTSIFKHGDKINDEGYTRLSFDFRVLPISALSTTVTKASITKGLKMRLGSYFISSSEL